jgi:hypothetical protein
MLSNQWDNPELQADVERDGLGENAEWPVVYIAGPMSGIEEYNYPAFREAAARLRDYGFVVVSPVELDEAEGYDPTHSPPGFDKPAEYAHFLSRDVQKIVEWEVEKIVVLPGWETSGGARTEVTFGQALGLDILEYPDLTPVRSGLATGEEVRVRDPETGGEKGQKMAQLGAVDPAALMEVAKVAGFGAQKYARMNFVLGYQWSLSYDAMMRHLLAFWNGEETDPESGLPHLGHAAWHCLTLMTFSLRGRGTDDRITRIIEEATYG